MQLTAFQILMMRQMKLKKLRADDVTTLKAQMGFNQGIKSSQSIRDSIHFPKYQ